MTKELIEQVDLIGRKRLGAKVRLKQGAQLEDLLGGTPDCPSALIDYIGREALLVGRA